MTNQAKTLFYDGQRVRREDLEFLQENVLEAVQLLGAASGGPGICWGFAVTGEDASTVSLAPGLAFDRWYRPILLTEQMQFTLEALGDSSVYLCAIYAPTVAEEVNGQPVRLNHGANYNLNNALPAPADDAIPIAEIRPIEAGYEIIQDGHWYLPPLNAGHSGQFFQDKIGRLRYDGHPVSRNFSPDFDSGWVSVAAHSDVNITHHLQSNELLVQLQIQPLEGTITNKGIGTNIWYELHGDMVIRLFNDTDEELILRAMLWITGAVSTGQLVPVADAGTDMGAEFGSSFNLDGSDSAAFAGRRLVRYDWTLMG